MNAVEVLSWSFPLSAARLRSSTNISPGPWVATGLDSFRPIDTTDEATNLMDSSTASPNHV